MKLAVFGHKHINTREGGIEVVVTELYKRIGHKCDTTVYDRHEPGYHEPRCSEPLPYKIKHSFTLKNGKLNAALASLISTIQCLFGRYDVIHVHAEGPCAFLFLLKHKKIVATVHGLDWQRAKWGRFASTFIRFGEKNMVKYADKIIVLSKEAQTYFKETYNRDTVLIENGVSIETSRSTAQISKYGLEPYQYILYVGRIVPEKRLDLLINAFKLSGIKKRLVIAGMLPEEMEHYMEFAQREPDILCTGFTTGELLRELYTYAGITVIPSDLEGMSISLLEGMAYGAPCLASDIPENIETLSGYGYTFRAGNMKDLSEKLIELSNLPFKKDMDMTAFVEERYNWDKVAEKTWDVIQECCVETPGDKTKGTVTADNA